jgi:NDP-sugar pyrophosphorylase family protein
LQAILLATGETKKLYPLTETIPSPMLSVVNRPVMAYNVELLGRLGFKQVVVSLQNQAGLIENYFGDGKKWGMSFQYVLQRDYLGSGGALRWAKRLLNETFIVLPADEIIQFDLEHPMQEHIERRALATVISISCSEEKVPALELDNDGRVIRTRLTLSNESGWVDTGIYIFEPCVLDLIPSRSISDIHQQLLPALIESGITVWASIGNGYWNPLNSFRGYAEAQNLFLSSIQEEKSEEEGNLKFRYTSVESHEIANGIFVGRNSRVHPNAHLVPPVSIGNNSWVGREVELGPNTVIGANVIIDDEATVNQSIVLDDTYVGKLVNIENRLVNQNLLVDLFSGDQVQVAEPFLLGKTKPDLVYERIRRTEDLILSAGLLLLMFPLILIITFLVWLSTGKVLQSVPYLTVNAKPSDGNERPAGVGYLYHFNISRNGEEPGWLGKWLVSWEGYRLPELYNVLRGKIRMIGLAPVFLDESNPLLSQDLSSDADSSAGFSGLWYLQSNYDRYLFANQLEDVQVIDKYYLATRSWRQDLWLLWQTPFAWYRRRLVRADSLKAARKMGVEWILNTTSSRK